MLDKNKIGEYDYNFLKLSLFLEEVFEKCDNEKEINWMNKNIQSLSATIANERKEEI